MAITLIASPDYTTPAYNPVVWSFDSNNKDNVGFRYIVDITINSETTRLQVPPDPEHGHGTVDISKILQSYLSAEDPTTDEVIDATNSYVQYSIKVGESYIRRWRYNGQMRANNPGVFWHNKTILTTELFDPPIGPTPIHFYSVGDLISINQVDDGAEYPALEGIHRIIHVISNRKVVIDVDWDEVGPGPYIPGYTNFSDNRITIQEDLFATTSTYYAYNAAMSHVDWIDYASDNHIIDFDERPGALSNIPSGSRVSLNSNLLINYLTNDITNTLVIETSDGELFINDHNINAHITTFNVGPGNLNEDLLVPVIGIFPVIKESTESYSIYLWDVNKERITEKLTFVLDRTCTAYPHLELMFLDRLGSIGSFTFRYRSNKQIGNTRTLSQNIIGGVKNGKWTYSPKEFSRIVRHIDTDVTQTLRTAWLSNEESEYFHELLGSPYVYLRGPDQRIYPVIIEDKVEEVKNTLGRKNIRYSINLRMSNTNNINW